MSIQKTFIILIILILLLVLLMYNNINNKNNKKNNLDNNHKKLANSNMNNKINIKNDDNYDNILENSSDYVLEIDNPDLSFSDDVVTSIDTINLYPNQYPYTFGYKPYYYRLYPYPLRPQYHYHKKMGSWLY
jgi:hypothetical protein